MEIRRFAERVLLSESVERKLQPPDEELTDEAPGDSWRIEYPARSEELTFRDHQRGVQMPHRDGLREPRLRAVAHHIMANHELQALEVMAFTLCAFPEAPTDFRFGLVDVIRDEQKHTRMHLARLQALGVRFGSLRVNGYVWTKAREFASPLDYCACLALTFEGGNLDHSLEFAEIFERFGDHRGAAVMKIIHDDEIRHVAFGLEWLRRLKPADQSDWDAYVSLLKEPMGPRHAMGITFQRRARFQAGLDADFVDRLEAIHRIRAQSSATPRKGRKRRKRL